MGQRNQSRYGRRLVLVLSCLKEEDPFIDSVDENIPFDREHKID